MDPRTLRLDPVDAVALVQGAVLFKKTRQKVLKSAFLNRDDKNCVSGVQIRKKAARRVVLLFLL